MKLKIEGAIQTRYVKGYGPFQRAYTESDPYTCQVDSESGRVAVGEDVTFWLERTLTGWALRAEVNTVPCLLGEIPDQSAAYEFSFMMLGAGDVELNGHARTLPNAPPVYVA